MLICKISWNSKKILMLQGKCIPLNIKKSNSSRVTCVVFLQLFLFQLHPQFHFADRQTDLLVYFMWKFTYMEKGLSFLLSKITEFISAEDKLYCYKEKLKLLVYIQTLYNCVEKTDKLTKKEITFSWTIPANCDNRKLKIQMKVKSNQKTY